MKIHLTETVERSSKQVWTILADEFNDISQWYAPVRRSYELKDQKRLPGASSAGRVCEFSDKPTGLQAHERILRFDAELGLLEIEVVPKNIAISPLQRNIATFRVQSLGPTQSRVELTASPELKAFGYMLYPMLKMGLTRGFTQLLQSLKQHAETTKQKVV
ncbi:MAG: SRPBCC family protein [Deltaproteobacteria bacterium]|nr:SRPBCC family protein [Deltaproteobacteria bacterium]